MAGRPPYPERYFPGRSSNGKDASHAAGTGAEAAHEEEISLRDILDTLLKGKWIILATFLTVVLLVAAYTFTVAPEYESTSTILVDTKQSPITSIETILSVGPGNRSVHNEVEILRSRTLAERVADRLLVTQRAPGSDEPLTILQSDSPIDAEEVAFRLRRSFVQIRPMGRDVDMIEVKATSTQPGEAALIAALYAEEYQRRNLEASRARMHASRVFLEEQESQYGLELQEAENALRSFLEAQNVVALDEEARQLVNQVTEIQVMRDQAQIEAQTMRAKLVELEQEVERIRPGMARRIGSGLENEINQLHREISQLELQVEGIYAENPDLRGQEHLNPTLDRLVRRMRALNTRVQQRAEEYFEEVMAAGGIDPMTIGRAGELSSAHGSLGYITALQRQVTEARIELSGYEARVNVLNERLSQYEQQLERMPNTSIRLAQLQRQAGANEQVWLFLQEKLQEARVAEQSELGYVEIVDEPAVPRDPVRPRKLLNLLLGAIVGMVLGVGLVFVRNAMDNRVRKPEDLRKHGHEVLGVIPDMQRTIRADFNGQDRVVVEGRSVSTSLISLLNPLSPIAEAYRRLRTNIQFSRPDSVVQVIMVTSAGPGEGKTATALNLAITMAQAGKKTLYIDGDLRRPAGHRAMGVQREPGIVELLFETRHVDVSSFLSSVDDLYVIPAGSSAPNPAELLGSRKMRDFILRLRNEFDIIIFDTPPVLPVTDAVLLSTQMDACILVASANETDWHAVDRSVESLKSVNAPLIGTVLNRFNPKAAYGYYSYSYGYGYGYYDYYGDREKKPEKATVKRL